jgi:dissimilatory sulfite reductase (desulfoviridin) alpha/beta subunit
MTIYEIYLGGIVMTNLTSEEIAGLKGQGFIMQRDKEHFICRIVTVDGTMDPKKMRKVVEISEKYGEGHMAFTSRLSIEIRGIKYEDIDKVKDELKEVGLYSGGTGARVRPITSCKGTVCTWGLLDTQELSRTIHERFYDGWYDVKLPHKFKIAVGGCPNNCAKPSLNDLGIMGQRKPKLDQDKCLGCKKCAVEETCKAGAAKRVDNKMKIDFDKCRKCGQCIGKCHFDAVELDKEGVKIFLGGKWGKLPRVGDLVNNIFTVEEALEFIEKSILYYKEYGKDGERFGDMIDRIGFEQVEKVLLTNEMIDRKEEILSAQNM